MQFNLLGQPPRIPAPVSESPTACTLFFKSFLHGVVLVALLNGLSLLAKVNSVDLIFVHVQAESIVSRHSAACTCLSVLSLGVISTITVVALVLNTDVLVEELLSGKVVHEVLRSDEATVFISIFEQDLVKTFDDGLHDLLEAEVHCLFLLVVGTNIFAELLVNLLNDAVQPVTHVSVSQFNFFVHLDSLVVELLRRLDLDVQLVDLWVSRATSLNFKVSLLVRVLHLQLVELLSHLLILTTKSIEFLLILAHCVQQLRVSRLTSEELLHDLLHIRKTCLGSNLLESLFDFSSSSHLFVHL